MLNFGKIRQETKHICFDVPNPPVPDSNFTIPKIKIPEINGPNLPDIASGILSFGKKVVEEIQNLEAKLKDVNVPHATGKLGFGLPSLNDFTSKLAAIKVPTTICITIGGQDSGLSSIIDQVNNAISSLPTPANISLALPNLPLVPIGPISDLVPSLRVSPIIPVQKSITDILSEIKDRCSQLLLSELDGLDPLLRLEQLLQRFQDLCGLMQFSQLRSVIDKIEQAKAELVRNAINNLLTPEEKIAKLADMAVDAINSGAQDILNEIANLADRIKFDSLLDKILHMNPRDAIAMLSDEIKRLAQLNNFSAIRQMLTAINVVKNQFAEVTNIGNTILNAPEDFLNTLQSKINEAADLQNYDAIETLLNQYDAIQDATIRALQELGPTELLQRGQALLNDALQKLDLGRYNRIMDEMAQNICTKGTDLLPNLPNVPEVNPAAIPNFLK